MTGVDKDLATVLDEERERTGSVVCWHEYPSLSVAAEQGCVQCVLQFVEAELSRLREQRDAAREHSREASEMYVQANEQITELLQQQSFMERKLAAQREDIERLATRVETAEAEVEADELDGAVVTGLAADLATVRSWLRDAYSHDTPHAALDRVEAELARLREDNALLRALPSRETVRRAEAAEAELSRLREQRDAWMDPFDGSGVEWHEGLPNPYTYQASDFSKLVSAVHEYECRAEAAEARCARLQQALIHHGYGPRLCKCANCEAAGPDTPADSPTHLRCGYCNGVGWVTGIGPHEAEPIQIDCGMCSGTGLGQPIPADSQEDKT